MSVQYAAEHFEDLVVAAHNGESVEIACAGQPALQLVRTNAVEVPNRVLGAGKAFTHLPGEEDLERIDREWKREIFDDGARVTTAEKKGNRVLGAGRGEIRVPSDEEWDAMDKEWRKSFEDKLSADAA